MFSFFQLFVSFVLAGFLKVVLIVLVHIVDRFFLTKTRLGKNENIDKLVILAVKYEIDSLFNWVRFVVFVHSRLERRGIRNVVFFIFQ